MSIRFAFLSEALTAEGAPYVWGAKGPTFFDCSGLVTWSLHRAGGPDWTAEHNARRLWDETVPVEQSDLKPGDLAFYGRGSQPGGALAVSHVMLWPGCGDRVYGACGGDSTTTTLEASLAKGAKVRYRASHLYRSDFMGFRRLQILDAEGA